MGTLPMWAEGTGLAPEKIISQVLNIVNTNI